MLLSRSVPDVLGEIVSGCLNHLVGKKVGHGTEKLLQVSPSKSCVRGLHMFEVCEAPDVNVFPRTRKVWVNRAGERDSMTDLCQAFDFRQNLTRWGVVKGNVGIRKTLESNWMRLQNRYTPTKGTQNNRDV